MYVHTYIVATEDVHCTVLVVVCEFKKRWNCLHESERGKERERERERQNKW